MRNKYEILSWDSDFFGFKIAKITRFENCTELAMLVQNMAKVNVRVAYVYIDQNDMQKNICLINKNAFHADEKTTYLINTEGKIPNTATESIVEFKNEHVGEKLIDLALQTSKYSRFRTDKNFGGEACDRLYKEWIIKSSSGNFDDKVFVFKNDKNIQGFITLKTLNDTGSIGLIGVDSTSRGNNIGSQLINKAISYFQDNGIFKIEVVTQKANIPACRFYERNGFTISSITNIYHLWI